MYYTPKSRTKTRRVGITLRDTYPSGFDNGKFIYILMALFIKSLKSIVKKNGNSIFLIPLPLFGIFTLYLCSIKLKYL